MAADANGGSSPVQLQDDAFDAFVEGNDVALIDFWAPWCGPCKRLEPVIEELANQYAGKVAFGKLNTDENPETPRRFGIMSIPTLLVFRDGDVVDSLVGAVPKPDIEERLQKHV